VRNKEEFFRGTKSPQSLPSEFFNETFENIEIRKI